MNFLKEMTGFYIHSVCLPEKATKRFEDFVGKNLEFKCSSGDVWHVGLIRSGDKLVLEPGWNNFASSNNVLQNDILLFQLVSGSTFEVRIFNSGVEKCDDSEGEADDDKVQEGIMSPYSNNINGIISAKPHSRKRLRSQNHNSLSLRKRLKNSDCGSHCQEKEKTACEEVHKVLSEKREEFLESENMNRHEEEMLEEARNNGSLVIEHQDHLGRKLGAPKNDTSETMTLTEINSTSAKPHSRKISRSQNHNSLPLRKRLKKSDRGSLCQEKEKTACEEMHKLLSEEREEFLENEGKYEISPPVKNMNRQKKKTLEEVRNNSLLVIEHQANLGRKLGPLENGTSETMTVTKKHSSQNQSNWGVPIDHVICGTRRWQAMNDEQKTRANLLALEIQTGNPAFLHILKYTHLHKKPSISVPKEFSVRHLKEASQTFILRRKENKSTWSVNYFFRRNRESSIEGISLLKFIEETNLKKDDICIFELAKIANQITFVVHICKF